MTRGNRRTIQSKITTRSGWILSLAFLIAGGVLLYASGTSMVDDKEQLSAFLSQFGGLLLGTGILTIAWDLVGRRAFADEVLAKAKPSTDVVDSGLTRVTDQYLQDAEWDDLFRDAHKIDIVVSYANTWRNTHRQRLLQAAARPGGRIRVFSPDYRDGPTMAVLAGRFNMKRTDLETRVKEAVEDFRSLHPEGPSPQVRYGVVGAAGIEPATARL